LWWGYLIDVFSSFGRRLDVGHSPLLCAVLSLFQRHFPPLAQVALVAHQKEGYVLVVLHSQYLVPEISRGLETVVVGDGEDAEETLAAAEVIVADGRVVLLPGRVQDVDLHLLAVQHHLLAIGIRLGRFIVFHKLIVMNCRVRADLPTPPLPTMMTLWTTGWLGVFLDAIFLLLLPLLTPLLSDGMLPNDELAGQWMPGSWWNRLRKLLSHLLPVSSTSGPDPGVTATAAGSLHCFCEGQANVKIFDWLRSSTSRRRWIAG